MTDRRLPGPSLAAGGARLGDLVAVAAFAAVLAGATVWIDGVATARADLAAAVLALALVAALPGYALLSCLTPAGRPAPRPAVVVPAASLTLSAVAALLLAVAPVTPTVASLSVALAAVTVFACAVAALRRTRGAVGAPVDWPRALSSQTGSTAVPVAGLAVTALVLVASLAYLGVAAPPPETFTSLSVHPQAEDASLDTFELSPGEETAVAVAVENHEGEREEYTLVARVEVVRTAGDETTVLGRQSSERFDLALGAGERWEQDHTVSPEAVPGRQRLVYYLYRGDAPASPTEASAYRSTVVWEPSETASE
jgi:uncharacterized membrane protein